MWIWILIRTSLWRTTKVSRGGSEFTTYRFSIFGRGWHIKAKAAHWLRSFEPWSPSVRPIRPMIDPDHFYPARNQIQKVLFVSSREPCAVMHQQAFTWIFTNGNWRLFAYLPCYTTRLRSHWESHLHELSHQRKDRWHCSECCWFWIVYAYWLSHASIDPC